MFRYSIVYRDASGVIKPIFGSNCFIKIINFMYERGSLFCFFRRIGIEYGIYDNDEGMLVPQQNIVN